MNREAGVRGSVQPPDAQGRIRDRTACATDVETENDRANGELSDRNDVAVP